MGQHPQAQDQIQRDQNLTKSLNILSQGKGKVLKLFRQRYLIFVKRRRLPIRVGRRNGWMVRRRVLWYLLAPHPLKQQLIEVPAQALVLSPTRAAPQDLKRK